MGLYPRLSTGSVSFTVFALFLGVAMSVTAFPVLARILTDRGMHKSPLGVLALTCAAVDDVTAWCLLAVVVGVAQAKIGGAAVVIFLAARSCLRHLAWMPAASAAGSFVDCALGSKAAPERLIAVCSTIVDNTAASRAERSATLVVRADAGVLGRAATLLGAGRLRKEDRISPGAAIMLQAKVGREVARGDVLCTLRYDDAARAALAEPLVRRAFQIGPRAPRPTPLVLETLR